MKISLKITRALFSILFVANSFAQVEFPQLAAATLDLDHNENTIIKDWTIFIFIAGDNNLKHAMEKNINELKKMGSNNNVNILVRVDTRDDEKKFTKIFYIAQDELIQIMPDTILDSGNPEDLVYVFSEIYERYPAHHWGLILWDHGIGTLDNPSMITDNPEEIHLWELLNRGICFDDSTHHYLTNKKIEYMLQKITSLLGKKIDLLGCDACFMNMWEFLRLIQPYAMVAVGSQEVEDKAGWDYYHALQPLNTASTSAQELATSIVHAYNNYYMNVNARNDYTQSAIDLTTLDMLNAALEKAAKILLIGMHNHPPCKELLRMARKESNTFMEPFFIDLYDFFHKLATHVNNYEPKNEREISYYKDLTDAITDVLQSIDEVVIANVAAPQICAHGISVYFPEGIIHASYYQDKLAEQDAWICFLENYLEIT